MKSEASLPRTRCGPGGDALRLESRASTWLKSSLAVAPVQVFEGFEGVVFDLRHEFFGHWRAFAGGAEGAVTHASAGATGDLGDLGRGQAAQAVAVMLDQAGEGDVVDVHIQAHTDRVGGDEEVDLFLLIERDLGVAGAG